MSRSPNGAHIAELIYKDEIRFGPAYYELSIDSSLLKDMIFGSPLEWSQDSRYLAAQEWLTTDYETGPVTRAIIFDLKQGCLSTLKIADKGFAQDFHFSDSAFIYRKHFQEHGEIIEAELNLVDIHNWKRFGS